MAVLRSDTFDVLNLSGPYLGEAAGNHIVIDSDAAAFGWFVDNTPQDDSEFSNAVSGDDVHG